MIPVSRATGAIATRARGPGEPDPATAAFRAAPHQSACGAPGTATWHTRRVTVDEDRASDRRIAIAFAVVLVVEAVLAAMADAGTYPLWVWLVLSIVAVLIAGLVFGLVQARAEGTPLWPRRPSATRPRP